MKYLIVICFIIASAAGNMPPAMKQKMEAIYQACMEKTGVDIELINKAMGGNFVDDPTLKAQILCVSKELGLLNDDGDFNMENITANIHFLLPDESKKDMFMSKCLVKKSSAEDTAFESVKCFQQILSA